MRYKYVRNPRLISLNPDNMYKKTILIKRRHFKKRSNIRRYKNYQGSQYILQTLERGLRMF